MPCADDVCGFPFAHDFNVGNPGFFDYSRNYEICQPSIIGSYPGDLRASLAQVPNFQINRKSAGGADLVNPGFEKRPTSI